MLDGKKLHVKVYEHMVARIHFGFYPKNKPLPSILKLSKQFNVSTMVVRVAYRLLVENGYVSERLKGQAFVLQDSVHTPQNLPDNILLDAETNDEIHRSFDLIFPITYYYGLLVCNDSDIKQLHEILEWQPIDWDEPALAFLSFLVRKLKNSLLNDLFYDVALFCYPTYLAENQGQCSHDRLCQMLELREKIDKPVFWHLAMEISLKTAPPDIPSTLMQNNIRYEWGRSQICLSAAGRIVSMIHDGKYPVGSFFPAADVMAEQLSMTLITMRRTIALLNDLGVVKSMNGKGTKVLESKSAVERVKWDSPQIRKNFMLYLNALHIQAITCQSLSDSLFHLLNSEERIQLREAIKLTKENGHVGAANVVCLEMLVKVACLPSLKSVYDKLFSLLIWGQPLIYLKPQLQIDSYIEQFVISLDENDAFLFGQTLKQSYRATFLCSQKKLISLGIEEANMLFLPNIEPEPPV